MKLLNSAPESAGKERSSPFPLEPSEQRQAWEAYIVGGQGRPEG